MSSSADRAEPRPLPTPELRRGTWTRLGDQAVLGDRVTEHTLAGLAEATRSNARAQGYAVGWAEGRRAARAEAAQAARATLERQQAEEQRREREHRAAVAALELAATRLHDEVASVCARVEDTAAGLARQLTELLVGHELTVEGGAAVVARALALAPREPVVAVRLNPAVAEGAPAADLRARGVQVVADPTLLPGDTVVETDHGAVDGRLGTALDRIREVLA